MPHSPPKNVQLHFQSHGRGFTVPELLDAFLLACGGDVTSAYFELQRTDLSEALLAVETHSAVQSKLNRARQAQTGRTEATQGTGGQERLWGGEQTWTQVVED